MTASSASQPASPRANSDYCLPPPQALIILPRQGAVLQVHIPAVCVTHGHTNRHKHTNRNINTDTDTYLHPETLYSQVEHSPLKGELKCWVSSSYNHKATQIGTYIQAYIHTNIHTKALQVSKDTKACTPSEIKTPADMWTHIYWTEKSSNHPSMFLIILAEIGLGICDDVIRMVQSKGIEYKAYGTGLMVEGIWCRIYSTGRWHTVVGFDYPPWTDLGRFQRETTGLLTWQCIAVQAEW